MSPEQIRKVVENFKEYLEKKEKIQNRLISLSGRDFQQEIILTQRLESLEQAIEMIDYADEDGILTPKEAAIVEHRIEGQTFKEIGKLFYLSGERVRQILNCSYQKIANHAKKKNLA